LSKSITFELSKKVKLNVTPAPLARARGKVLVKEKWFFLSTLFWYWKIAYAEDGYLGGLRQKFLSWESDQNDFKWKHINVNIWGKRTLRHFFKTQNNFYSKIFPAFDVKPKISCNLGSKIRVTNHKAGGTFHNSFLDNSFWFSSTHFWFCLTLIIQTKHYSNIIHVSD